MEQEDLVSLEDVIEQSLAGLLRGASVSPPCVRDIAHDIASEIAAHVVPGDCPRAGLELGTIRPRVGPGGEVRLVSRKGRNYLVNWKKVLLNVVPTIAATTPMLKEYPYLGAVACLCIFPVLVEAGEVVLGENHGRVVLELLRRGGTASVRELNERLSEHLKEPMVSVALVDLVAIGCVSRDGENVTLREEIRFR